MELSSIASGSEKKGKNVDAEDGIEKEVSATESTEGEEGLGADLTGDYHNIAILVFLYILQGIPLGLSGSIPMILINRKASYQQQATFSFVVWPFSVKLLWAPIVDSVYNKRFGRRKSWLVPTQYLIGLFMFVLSFHINDLLGEAIPAGSITNVTNTVVNSTITNSTSGEPIVIKPPTDSQILWLTLVFFILDLLAATQDVAVDGWALTMLKRRNVAYAPTCNSVGQTLGIFLGNVVFLALESSDFCHKFLWFLYTDPESKEGLVTLSSFLLFWGIVFFIATTLVMIFKHDIERNILEGIENSAAGDINLGIMETYKLLFKILKLRSVQVFILILFTMGIGSSSSDTISGLKMVEFGVKKENLAMLWVPMFPLQIILPWFLSKYTSGPRPLNLFLVSYPIKMLFGLVVTAIVYFTYASKLSDGSFPVYYYAIVLITFAIRTIIGNAVFVSLLSFFAKIADPTIGGTYMTLLNTLTNLGSMWPSTLALYTVEWLNIKSCKGDKCEMVVDGFYIQSVIGVILGIVWILWARTKINRLQQLEPREWLVAKT